MVPLNAQPNWTTDLLETMSGLAKNGCYNNVRITCCDGSVSVSGLLLASVWPLLRRLGTHVPEDEMVIYLPDIDVSSMAMFIGCLLATRKPTLDDLYLFTSLLTFFDKDLLDLVNLEPLVKQEMTDEVDLALHVDIEQVHDDMVEQTFVEKKKFTSYDDCFAHLFDPILKRFMCSFCQKGCIRSGTLARHMEWHMLNPDKDFSTRFSCQECNKVFPKDSVLKQHIMNKHTVRLRKFKCTWKNCSKAFKTANELKAHGLRHTGEKKFTCENCGRSFLTKGAQHNHTLRMHSGLERSIPCELCGKLFKTVVDVRLHMVTHRARQLRVHRCDECNLTFRKEEPLKKHMILHNADRHFACSKCPLRYKTNYQLLQHGLAHGNKRFPCTLCHLDFGRIDYLKKHVRAKHSN